MKILEWMQFVFGFVFDSIISVIFECVCVRACAHTLSHSRSLSLFFSYNCIVQFAIQKDHWDSQRKNHAKLSCTWMGKENVNNNKAKRKRAREQTNKQTNECDAMRMRVTMCVLHLQFPIRKKWFKKMICKIKSLLCRFVVNVFSRFRLLNGLQIQINAYRSYLLFFSFQYNNCVCVCDFAISFVAINCVALMLLFSSSS